MGKQCSRNNVKQQKHPQEVHLVSGTGRWQKTITSSYMFRWGYRWACNSVIMQSRRSLAYMFMFFNEHTNANNNVNNVVLVKQ